MLPKGRVLMDNASLSFFQAYVMPFMLITAHSLAIMIALLLALAFFAYADRKSGPLYSFVVGLMLLARSGYCKVLRIF